MCVWVKREDEILTQFFFSYSYTGILMGDRNTVTGTQNAHSTHKNTDLLVYSGMSRIESVFARLCVCVFGAGGPDRQRSSCIIWTACVSVWLCFKARGGFIRRWITALPHCRAPGIFFFFFFFYTGPLLPL